MDEELYEHVIDCSARYSATYACDRPLSAAQRRVREALKQQVDAEDAQRCRRRDALIRLRDAATQDPRLADLLLLLVGEDG